MPQTNTACVPQEYAFSAAEYQARMTRVREAMKHAELDVLLVHEIANICYLTGYQTPLADWYHCLILTVENVEILQVCDTELAQMNTRVSNIVGVDWEQMQDAAPNLVAILFDHGLDKSRIGLETRRPGLDPHTSQCLRSQLPEAQFVDASELVLQIRTIKSTAEISLLREAAQLSVVGMRAATDRIEPGVSDNEIGATASAEMLAHGSEFFSIAPIVRTGRRSGVTHATSKRNPVAPGDPVLIELGGVVQRYCAPLLRTAVLGSPSHELQKLADTSLQVMDILFKELVPGRSLDSVARDAARGLANLNTEVKMRGYFGYSVGVSFPPSWVERSIEIAEGRNELLQPGMVFHAHRSMRISGQMGVGFSETVLITENGCEFLTDFPRTLFQRAR